VGQKKEADERIGWGRKEVTDAFRKFEGEGGRSECKV
jgi:hypothetical protein